MSDNFEKEIKDIFLDEIIPNRFQPRLNFDQKALMELAESIKQHGIIQPLVLRKLGDKYEIIAGERRYKASQLIGLVKVPAIIVDFDDNKSAEVAIVENLHRKDMTSFEEAQAYKKLLERGITQEQLGLRLGKSQPYIANKLRLLSLGEEVKEALIKEKISERHARSLLVIKDVEEQKKLLEEIISKKLTVKETDDIIKEKYGENKEEEAIEQKNDNKVKEDELIDENFQEISPIHTIQENITQQDEKIEEESKQEESVMQEQVFVEQKSNNENDIMNFSLDNIVENKEQQIIAPKPFIIVDSEPQKGSEMENKNMQAEPHNNKEYNPQKDLIEKISNVNSPFDELLFRDTNNIKSSPYVIPKTDIKDNYLVPETSFQPKENLQVNLQMENELSQRSFSVDQIWGSNQVESNKSIETPNNINNNSQSQNIESVKEEKQQQNRFIVDLKEPKREDDQDIENSKNMIKKVVEGIKSSGIKIDFEEFDFERLYQIIIKIDK